MITWALRPERLAIIAAGSLLVASSAIAAENHVSIVEIRGTATFESATSVPMITIHGKSTGLEGRARIRHDGDSLVVEDLEAVLPVRTLSTGMSLRDEHMRKYVFTTSDGAVPDVRSIADRVVCAGTAGAKRTCQLSGDLTIRGTSRPFSVALDVKSEGAAYKAVGVGVTKLSEYGIPAPSQLGVTTSDEVKLRLDFSVKRVEERIAQRTDH